MRHAVIVTAAGSSCRFNENSSESLKKEFCKIKNHSVLYCAVEPFLAVDGICAVVITYQKGLENETKEALEDLPQRTNIPFFFVEGGETRQQSVFYALEELQNKNSELKAEYVSIHDGARPFVSRQLIGLALASAVMYGACAPAITVNDTLVKKERNFIASRMDRTDVVRIQTPQIFKFPDIFDAHLVAAERDDKVYTDDTEIYMDYGRKVSLIEGSPDNIKITYRKDLC